MTKGGSSSRAQDGGQTGEEKAVEVESKRLRELALSRGLLSQYKANAAATLRPTFGVLRCDGKDIIKKGHRKNKYLFAFPGLVAPVAGGKFGDLTQLDSRNPILYIDFPQGRLKLFGTIVYPKTKYLTLHFLRGAGNIHCEDCFESLVVFPVAWWIGTKEENPDELRLEMPQDLQQEKHAVFDFAAGAGRARRPKDTAEDGTTEMEPDVPGSPKGQLKMDRWLFGKKTLESDVKATGTYASDAEVSDEEDGNVIHLGDTSTPVRQSARTAGKKYTYTESQSEEDDGTDSGSGSDGSDAKQKKRRLGGNTVNNLFTSKDVDDGFLDPESQASKKDVAGPSSGTAATYKMSMPDATGDEETNAVDLVAASQTSAARTSGGGALQTTSVKVVATASASAGGSKQSSLSAFFSMSSDKDKKVTVEQSVTKVEIGSAKEYTRKKDTKSTLDEENSADKEKLIPAPKAKKASVPQKTPSESKGSQQKKQSTSEGKQTSKGSGAKGKSPVKKRKLASKESQSKEQPIVLVSDDSDAS